MPQSFFIDPNMGRGNALSGLADTIRQNRERKDALARADAEKAQAAQQKAALDSEFTQLLQGNDPAAIATFTGANPQYQKAVESRYVVTNAATKQITTEMSARLLATETPEQAVQILQQGAQSITDAGGTPTFTTASLEALKAGDPNELQMVKNVASVFAPDIAKSMRGDEVQDVAEVAAFKFLTQGLSEEEKSEARRKKLGLSARATESANVKAEKAYKVEVAKLQAKYELEPQVAAAVQSAKNESEVLADESQEQKSNDKGWDVYSGAMDNLSASMSGTETGPFAGLIPAVTASQQIAQGAVAVMAPVLKQMFRSSGEGTFTDKDQEMLLAMVPTRKDLPAAREAKISAIDAVVRAKLGKGESAKSQEQSAESSGPKTVTTQDELALQWAQSNAGDPRAAQILKKLGVQQ